MTIKPKTKRRRGKKLKAPVALKRPITESVCKDEIIWNLYSQCLKIKKRKNIKNIKIYLQNVDFPVSMGYKTNYLDNLKKRKIIKNYKLNIEKEKFPPTIIEKTIEPNIELLPLISLKELKGAPKDYEIVNHSAIDYVATIECNPQKVIQYIKNDFKRINRKRKEIIKRKKIESFFEKEETLKYDGLKFGLETGNAIYGKAITNFVPGSNEYKLLKILMRNLDKRLEYQKISDALFGPSRWKPNVENSDTKRSISFCIKRIKEKLKITGSEPVNENLFFGRNGYGIGYGSEE